MDLSAVLDAPASASASTTETDLPRIFPFDAFFGPLVSASDGFAGVRSADFSDALSDLPVSDFVLSHFVLSDFVLEALPSDFASDLPSDFATSSPAPPL